MRMRMMETRVQHLEYVGSLKATTMQIVLCFLYWPLFTFVFLSKFSFGRQEENTLSCSIRSIRYISQRIHTVSNKLLYKQKKKKSCCEFSGALVKELPIKLH